MRPISINEYLNKKNPWSLRLLGLTDFKKDRNIDQIEREYNQDKYASLLKFDFKTIEEYKTKEFELGGNGPDNEMIISTGDDIFGLPVSKAREQFYELIKKNVQAHTSGNICELGCGYGYNLSFLGTKTYGGEYSTNAVKLARKLGLEVSEFNYYKPDDYNFIKPDTTIFTTHSIEQIPDASVIISSLEKQKHKINYVVHLEPTIVEERSNFIGLLRNRYIEINDYNRNLITLLKNNPSIEIIELKYDVFGLVPLNSTNLVIWKFRN